MTWWMVLSIGWSCRGDFWGIKAIPEPARPLASIVGICSPRPFWEAFSKRDHAERRIKELGPGRGWLSWCRGLRCWEPKSLRWSSDLEIDGRRVQ